MSHSAGTAPHDGVRAAPVTRWRDGQATAASDWLADEVPVALVFNGLSHAVMMATPADLADFALGFSLTEGLLGSASDLYGVEQRRVDSGRSHGIELQLEVSSRCFAAIKERRRTLAGRTGCGLCGTDSLDQVCQTLPAVPATVVTTSALAAAQQGLRQGQAMQALTGASHAAAWCAGDGAVRLLREDVGRHNALDKLIGAMVKAGIRAGSPAAADGFIAITSRASFEMVQKTALAGVGLLSAVSAPTALAVATAQRCGLALAGFTRGDDFVAYTFPERFGLPAAAPHLIPEVLSDGR